MTRIYYAGIDTTTTENEYAMTEISAADHGEEWNGDTLGYVQNMDLDSDYTVGSEADLGNVHQNFGGLDPIPGSIIVLLQGDVPVLVYWASEVTASWLTGPARISVNNGRTYCTPAEAIAALPWETIVNAMDDETRETVAFMGHDDPEDFLTAYLAAAPCDLIIG